MTVTFQKYYSKLLVTRKMFAVVLTNSHPDVECATHSTVHVAQWEATCLQTIAV